MSFEDESDDEEETGAQSQLKKEEKQTITVYLRDNKGELLDFEVDKKITIEKLMEMCKERKGMSGQSTLFHFMMKGKSLESKKNLSLQEAGIKNEDIIDFQIRLQGGK